MKSGLDCWKWIRISKVIPFFVFGIYYIGTEIDEKTCPKNFLKDEK